MTTENKVTAPEFKNENSKDSSLHVDQELVGKITSIIGTGGNAKDSIVWMTITWSFNIAAGISFILFFRSFFSVSAGESLLDSIMEIWSVFVPIITLALGYAFGKGS